MNKIRRLLIVVALLLMVPLSIFGGKICAFAAPPEAVDAEVIDSTTGDYIGNDRYTVLLLDTAGKEVFHFYYSGAILIVGGPEEYITNDSIDEVKASAAKFISDAKYSLNKNYIAIVTYNKDAAVVSDFTDDYDKLESDLNGITSIDDNNDGNDNVTAGLKCANELLSGISDKNAIKNILLCTTGLVCSGENNYSGLYCEETVGSDWQNEVTEIRLYAYANCAVEAANKIKDAGTTIYVVGIFQPIESSLPSKGKDIAEFFRLTAHDIASSEETYYIVEDPTKLDFVFGELQGDVTGTAKVRIYNDSDGYYSNDQVEYPDNNDKITLGGHYEEMKWGPSLFETPATRMHLQSIVSEDSPNYNLAMVCGNLCITSYSSSYLKQTYNILGFDDKNIFLYSYPSSDLNRTDAKRNGNKFAEDADLAFSIASREIEVNGEKSDLLVITLRGTQEKWEAVKDGTCKDDKDFYEYKAWDWIYEFEEDVFAGLEDYHNDHPALGERKLKIMVTGHSLGGAGANLVAAKLCFEQNSDNWFSKNTTADDIYSYTFGAIDSISKDATNSDIFKERKKFPVVDGFENIINIYNYLDTFGPNGGGVYGFTASGKSMYGKFGMFYTFTNDMRGAVNPDSMWPTHEIAGYIHAVKSGWLSSDKETDKIKVWIRCPVDIEIYENDTLVCSVVEDVAKAESDKVSVVVENNAKAFILSKNVDYKIIIKATDSGTMEYSVQNLDSSDLALQDYKNVSLTDGKRMLSELADYNSVEDIELYQIDANGTKIAKIQTDGTESKTKDPKTYSDFSSSEKTDSEKMIGNDLMKYIPYFVIILLVILIVVCVLLIVFRIKKRGNKSML